MEQKLRELHVSEDDLIDSKYSYKGHTECVVDRSTYQDGIVHFNKKGDMVINVPWKIFGICILGDISLFKNG